MIKKIEIKGVTFSYSVEGKGKAVVLMHGWGCNRTTLSSIENLLKNDYLVYNVDFPGFGNSSEPNEVWGVEDYTQLIEALIKEEQIENPILLGHSFGGRVGLLYASRNVTDKLILVDAAGVKPTRTLKYYYKVYSYKLLKQLILSFYGKEKGEIKLNKLRSKKGSSDYKNASNKMRAIMSKVVNEDLKHIMPQIKCETLLIWGENDTATPLKDAKIMERLIPNAGLVSFPGVGHYSFLENAIQFQAVLKSFLNIK